MGEPACLGACAAQFDGPAPEIAATAGSELPLTTTAIVFDRAAVIEHNRIVLKYASPPPIFSEPVEPTLFLPRQGMDNGAEELGHRRLGDGVRGATRGTYD
jgi:hypothetical protein